MILGLVCSIITLEQSDTMFEIFVGAVYTWTSKLRIRKYTLSELSKLWRTGVMLKTVSSKKSFIIALRFVLWENFEIILDPGQQLTVVSQHFGFLKVISSLKATRLSVRYWASISVPSRKPQVWSRSLPVN